MSLIYHRSLYQRHKLEKKSVLLVKLDYAELEETVAGSHQPCKHSTHVLRKRKQKKILAEFAANTAAFMRKGHQSLHRKREDEECIHVL